MRYDTITLTEDDETILLASIATTLHVRTQINANRRNREKARLRDELESNTKTILRIIDDESVLYGFQRFHGDDLKRLILKQSDLWALCATEPKEKS